MWVEKTKSGNYKFVERYKDYLTGKKNEKPPSLWRRTMHLLENRLQKCWPELLRSVRPHLQLRRKSL